MYSQGNQEVATSEMTREVMCRRYDAEIRALRATRKKAKGAASLQLGEPSINKLLMKPVDWVLATCWRLGLSGCIMHDGVIRDS